MNLKNRITGSSRDDFPFDVQERVAAFDVYDTLIKMGIEDRELGKVINGYLDEHGPVITDSEQDIVLRRAALIELDELYCASKDPVLRGVLDHYRKEGHYDSLGVNMGFLEYDPIVPGPVESSGSELEEVVGAECWIRRELDRRDEYFSEGVPTKMHRGPGNNLMTDVGVGFYQRNPGLGSAIISWGATIATLAGVSYFVYNF